MKISKTFNFSYIDKIQELQKLKITGSTKRIFLLIFIFPFLAGNWSCAVNKTSWEKEIVQQGNKIIP